MNMHNLRAMSINAAERKLRWEAIFRGIPKITAEKYVFYIRSFLEFFGKISSAVTESDACVYLARLKDDDPAAVPIAAAAISFYFREIRGKKSFVLSESPVFLSPDSRLTPLDIRRVAKSATYTRDKLIIELFFSVGLTPEEIVGLQTKNILIDDRLIALGRKRYAAISDEFVEMYVHFLTERYYSGIKDDHLFSSDACTMPPDECRSLLSRLAARAGVLIPEAALHLNKQDSDKHDIKGQSLSEPLAAAP